MANGLMRAVVMRDFGGPQVLRGTRMPIPEPGPGQVLVEVEAVSVGHAQVQMRSDVFPAAALRPIPPVVLGGDIVGVVRAVGPDAAGTDDARPGPRVGDRVGAYLPFGANAEFAVAPLNALVPVPDGLDSVRATALPGTAAIAAGILDVGGPVAGRTVLVHAAAGGTGHLAVQLALHAKAAVVLGTAGSAAKREYVLSLGATAAVDYSQDGFEAAVLEALGGRGADLVLDGVGGRVLRAGPRLLAPGGRLVCFGAAAGRLEERAIDPLELMGLKSVTGFMLSAWRAARPERSREVNRELAAMLADGSLDYYVEHVLPFAQAGKAHELVEAREVIGRVVLVP
jgi:NADPH2:quinone reductase